MNFEQVLPALREGKKITRSSSKLKWHYRIKKGLLYLCFTANRREMNQGSILFEDMMAADWQVVDGEETGNA